MVCIEWFDPEVTLEHMVGSLGGVKPVSKAVVSSAISVVRDVGRVGGRCDRSLNNRSH